MKEKKIEYHYWVSKKFQGFGFMFSADPPIYNYSFYCIEFKFLFYGGWIRIKKR